MYKIYLGDVIFPVAPSSIEIKISNKNKTVILINENEVNFLRNPGLTNIRFDLLLPNVKYPFAEYPSGFKDAYYYLDYIKKLKVNKKPFMFRIGRYLPTGTIYSDRSIKVSLEEYTIKDDANNGFDIVVSLQLKQYRDFGTRLPKITFIPRPAQNSIKTSSNSTTEDLIPTISDIKAPRQTENSPEPEKVINISFKEDMSTMEIAKMFYGDIDKYVDIEDINDNIVMHYVLAGNTIKLPGKKLPTQEEIHRSIMSNIPLQ